MSADGHLIRSTGESVEADMARLRDTAPPYVPDHPLRRWRFEIVAAVLAFSVADVLVTQTYLTHGTGLSGEGNPLMAPLIMTWWAWPVRVGIPALVLARHLRKEVYGPMALAAVLYGAVVAWNVHNLVGLPSWHGL